MQLFFKRVLIFFTAFNIGCVIPGNLPPANNYIIPNKSEWIIVWYKEYRIINYW